MSYYNLDARFVPIESWPGERTLERRRSPFSTVKEKVSEFRGVYKQRERGADWGNTLKLLKRELAELQARNIVIEIDMPESSIRQDGYPKSNATARSPGVIISCETKYGAVRYPCDAFTHWQDNVRAIALALEALRKVDRYGVTKRGEQYTGWKKLGTGVQPAMSLERAAAFVAATASTHDRRVTPTGVQVSAEAYRAAYVAAAKVLHPDAGGDTDRFQQLQEARRVLDLHHGVR